MKWVLESVKEKCTFDKVNYIIFFFHSSLFHVLLCGIFPTVGFHCAFLSKRFQKTLSIPFTSRNNNRQNIRNAGTDPILKCENISVMCLHNLFRGEWGCFISANGRAGPRNF